MKEIYTKCLDHYRDVSEFDWVVENSIPIPFFGDLVAYNNSEKRVLTVALNPSDKEFPKEGNPRFTVENALRGPKELETELSVYFERNPYFSWFSSFEHVLSGLDCTYGGKMIERSVLGQSTALHVDLCSPIATNPTWGKLDNFQKCHLVPTGIRIFDSMIANLKPHLIIASVGKSHLNSWRSDLRNEKCWSTLLCYDTKTDGSPMRSKLVLKSTEIEISGHKCYLANGSMRDKPFGSFSIERKREVGECLSKLISQKV